VEYCRWVGEIAPFMSETDKFWLRLSYEECTLRLLAINQKKILQEDEIKESFVENKLLYGDQ
jgi:hypothetical protein